MGATPGTIAGSTLHERAMAALPRWLCSDPVTGLYEALFPDDSMGLIEEAEARVVALALRGVGQSVGFLGRWRQVRIEQGLAAPDIADASLAPAPQEAIEMLRPVLRGLWPEWEGWAAPPPRQHIMEEYVYDLQTARFWDLVYCRPIADAALDADIWRACWPTIVVDGKQIAIPPSEWMKSREVGYLVDAVARIPGAGRIVSDVMFDHTGRRYVPGTRLFNTWRTGPAVEPDAPDADKWLDLACRLFEGRSWWEVAARDSFGTLNRVVDRFAWIVQHPGEPLPGALVLLSPQGVGKDALLLPLAYALGWWNTANVMPDELVGRFNPFVEADLVIVNEVRIVHRDGGAHQFYSRLKSLSTRPPDTIARDEKNVPVRYVPKTASHIITSNEVASLYLPKDDRRYDMPDIKLKARWHIDAGLPHYFTDYFRWLKSERGYAAVHKFLSQRDLSRFDPAAPPPSSAVKQRAQAASVEGDSMLAWALEQLGNPDGFFGAEVREIAYGAATGEKHHELLLALRSSQQFDRRLEELGYVSVPPPTGASEWVVDVTFGDPTRTKTVRKRSRKAYVRTDRATERASHIEAWLIERMTAWAKGQDHRPSMPPPPPLVAGERGGQLRRLSRSPNRGRR